MKKLMTMCTAVAMAAMLLTACGSQDAEEQIASIRVVRMLYMRKEKELEGTSSFIRRIWKGTPDSALTVF